jgi:hypothetical protein
MLEDGSALKVVFVAIHWPEGFWGRSRVRGFVIWSARSVVGDPRDVRGGRFSLISRRTRPGRCFLAVSHG